MNRLVVIFGVLFFLAACTANNTADKTEETTALPPQYWYYPKANLYFDSANKEYIFQGNDSLQWQSAKQIPAVVLVLMDKSVFLENPPNPVWQDNATHKLVYSAVLYATPKDTVAKKVVKPVVRKQPSVPVLDTAATEEKKERKGIGRLLDKIFGGKKKKKDAGQPEASEQNN